MLSYTLTGPDDAAVAVALNFGDAPAHADLPERAWQPEAGSPTADLPPYGWMVATS